MKFIYSDINYLLNTINKDLKLDYDNTAIKNSIRNILTIRIGTLVGNPTFGSNLESLLFSIEDDLTFDLAEEMVVSAIQKWEPRILLQNVNAYSNSNQQLIIEADYKIIKSSEISSAQIVIG